MEPRNFLHKHPLHFFEEWSSVNGETRHVNCSSGCGQPISTQFYACIDCKFFLHKSCSELPLNITHPLHDKHPLILLSDSPYESGPPLCDFCSGSVNGFVYHCSSCKFDLDIICALLPQFLNGDLPKVDHHIHVEHPLFFIKNLSHEVKLAYSRYCSVCLEQLSSDASFYTCVVCKLFLHKSCSETELPLNINHPFHEKHTLTLNFLKRDGKVLCQFCNNDYYDAGLFYHCSSCFFKLHIRCAFLPQFLTGNFPKRDHHFSDVDEHPLFFIQKNLISDGNKVELRSHCFVCPESLSGSSFYYCPECQFFLHKSCVFEELPLKINHSLHDEHALTLKKDRARPACKFCLNVIEGLRYSCSCSFHLDDRCALLITKDLPKRDHHFSHVEHPLVFVQMFSNEVKINSSCSVCSKPLLGTSFYNCPDCQFFFHKECEAELSTKVKHFAHPQHPLFPRFSPEFSCTCHFCQGKSDGKEVGYQCRSCDFYIHRKCTLPRFVPESKIHDHDHQLIPFIRENLFITCDACGGSGGSAGYFCVQCNLRVHRGCILLPKTIKFKLHNHHKLGHNYWLPQKEGEKWTCQFCFKKGVAEYGSYKCLHSDCNYILHGSCVKRNQGRLYIEVESEHKESDEASSSSSSSSCAVVLGDNIKHFSHKHELVLNNEEIITNGDEKCCDGCALPILTAAYSCPRAECNFSLHKACAQIGERKPHWAFRGPLRVSMNYCRCQFCNYGCSGFGWFEKIRDDICLRCSEIPFITTHEAHDQHPLFCDRDHKGPCSGCGKEMGKYGGYKCTLAEEEENCKFFALDYRCLTRPLTAQHRFHHHPLKLTYEDPYEDDGDPFQHMCEICEDRRDPKLWFYRCDECDFDAHPDCVLGKYPFIKRGSILPDYVYNRCDYHDQRPLIYFQSEKYPYPKCNWCGHPCKDQLALKCPHSECNFALHFNDCYSNRQCLLLIRRLSNLEFI